MLTKDLLRYKVKKNQIIPSFISVDEISFLHFAEQLIEIFSDNVDRTRETLLESSKALIESQSHDMNLMKGLEKILLDRTEFDTALNEELQNFRHELFLYTSQLLSTTAFESQEQYFKSIEQQFTTSTKNLALRLYQDLPAHQQILAFKTITPEHLLHRYNCALVQSLLLRSEQLEVHLITTDSTLIRQLFKYLRFHQLLCEVKKTQEGYTLFIDGPMSMFMQTQKYGLNLANFFPAILHQPQWKIMAQIQLSKSKNYQFHLDQSCQIRSHYHRFLAYTPESIRWFSESLEKSKLEWKAEIAEDFIALPGEDYCFPDYVISHPSGASIPLELYHAWHSSSLEHRVHQLSTMTKPVLLLGVHQSLKKNAETQHLLLHSEYFQQYGFYFREMPTAKQLEKILEKLIERQATFL